MHYWKREDGGYSMLFILTKPSIAFDITDHDIDHELGVLGTILQWFHSYSVTENSIGRLLLVPMVFLLWGATYFCFVPGAV